MHRWPIWVLACTALCGCQAGLTRDDSCPYLILCEDPGSDAMLRMGSPPLGSTSRRVVTRAAWQPPRPGCPTSLQVMPRPAQIVFHAVKPDEAPDAPSDPSDWACEPPEAPLLRAGTWRSGRHLAAR